MVYLGWQRYPDQPALILGEGDALVYSVCDLCECYPDQLALRLGGGDALVRCS